MDSETPSEPQAAAETPGAEEVGPAVPSARHGLLRYTLERLALFAAVTGILWLVGLRANLLLTLALGLVLSGFISMFLLNRSRDAASTSVTGVFTRINQRIDESSRAEDEQGDESSRAEDEQSTESSRAEDEQGDESSRAEDEQSIQSSRAEDEQA